MDKCPHQQGWTQGKQIYLHGCVQQAQECLIVTKLFKPEAQEVGSPGPEPGSALVPVAEPVDAFSTISDSAAQSLCAPTFSESLVWQMQMPEETQGLLHTTRIGPRSKVMTFGTLCSVK